MEAMHENKNSLVRHSSDPRFINLLSLQTPRGRSRTGLYLIEGIRHVARAVDEHAPIQSIFAAPSALSNPFGKKLARKLRQSGVECLELSPWLYGELTRAAEPQGLGAVLRQRNVPIQSVRPGRDSLWLAVESVDAPGNLGTIIRTAEATGVSGIFIVGPDADPYDPAAVRASMGSLFSQKLVRCSKREFTGWAREFGVAIVGSSPGGLLDYKSFRCRWPAALLIGNEKRGVSDDLLEVCNFTVRIPMLGRTDSINVAVAAGVLLYELFEQRRSFEAGIG
jgi:TrmH family RNA methyltransferase